MNLPPRVCPNIALKESCLMVCLVCLLLPLLMLQPVDHSVVNKGTFPAHSMKLSKVAAKCSVGRGGTPAHLI